MDMLNVALLAMKPRLRDILTQAIRRSDNLKIVEWGASVQAPMDDLFPDVFVQEVNDLDDGMLPADLLRGPMRGRVLLVNESGSDAALYEIRMERGHLSNVSVDQLIDAIRHGMGPGARLGSVH